MRIVKIDEVAQGKRIVIKGFKHGIHAGNDTLIINSDDFIELQNLMLEVYYS